jgi:hypothetical protein
MDLCIREVFRQNKHDIGKHDRSGLNLEEEKENLFY